MKYFPSFSSPSIVSTISYLVNRVSPLTGFFTSSVAFFQFFVYSIASDCDDTLLHFVFKISSRTLTCSSSPCIIKPVNFFSSNRIHCPFPSLSFPFWSPCVFVESPFSFLPFAVHLFLTQAHILYGLFWKAFFDLFPSPSALVFLPRLCS